MNKLKCLFTALLTGISFLSAVSAQGQMPAANVRVAYASVQTIAPETIVPGTVVSRNDAKLAAEVTGQLLELADVGTLVVKGDVVAKIEDTGIKLRKDELQAEVERVQARLKFLESEESRYVQLAKSNLAAATKLEETRSDRDVSRGDLQVAKSRLAQVEDQLSRTSIRAPLEYYSYVRRGQKLALSTGLILVTGSVRTVVAVGSENTHLFELRVDVEGGSFPVGQTLRVSIPVSNSRDALVVPRDALVLRPEGISVFVVDSEQNARQVMVTTGLGSGDQIEVNGDLVDGDTVIIRGNERLKPGQSVSIMEG